MATSSQASSPFKCRKCRHPLFTSDDLLPDHAQVPECSSWYLKDDDLLPWIQVLVDESGWTEGKLCCPKCNGRVGGFDFLHVVQCSCLVDVIPAIWCPKSRIDMVSSFGHRPVDRQKLDTENGKEVGGESGTGVEGSRVTDSTSSMAVSARSGAGNLNAVCMSDTKEIIHNFPSTSVTRFQGPAYQETEGYVSNVKCSSSGSASRSNCNHHRVSDENEMFYKDICNKKHSTCQHHCCKCQFARPNFNYEFLDSSVACGYAEGGPCRNCTDSCITLSHIQEGLEEIKKEVVNMSPRNVNSQESVSSKETLSNRRRKQRRRGRSNWLYGQEYVKSLEEIKKSKDQYKHQDAQKDNACKRRMNTVDEVEEVDQELSDSEIPDCYKCSVCLCLLHEPLKTQCQHVFCALCIRQLNHVTRRRPKCPLCRQPIKKVEPEEELGAEIQISFPVNCRKRAKETKKSRYKRFDLPTPNSTMFDSLPAEDGSNARQSHLVAVIALVISLLINVLLANFHGNQVARINLQRNMALFILIVGGCMFASLLLLFLALFALDFVKIALLLVLSYFAMTKLILRAAVD